jgi:hypothetical protein
VSWQARVKRWQLLRCRFCGSDRFPLPACSTG